MLKQAGISHNILNAKHHEREAYIIAQAGRYGAVTIATNMAGRGTDILLGGNSEYMAKEYLESNNIHPETVQNYEEIKNQALAKAREITVAEHQKVVEAGGLHVIGTERHESRRIDNQLRGRAARQGDPGSTQFFISLEDNLMRIMKSDIIIHFMETMNYDETQPITSSLITRQIESAQRKIEVMHFDIRKSVLQYDDVINIQREKFYKQRSRVLAGENLRPDILYMIECDIDRTMKGYITPEMSPHEYIQEDLVAMLKDIQSSIPQLSSLKVEDIATLNFQNMYEKIKQMALNAYAEHERNTINFYNDVMQKYNQNVPIQFAAAEDNVMRHIEKDVLLRTIDNKWIDHLHNIDMLRDGIGLRAYGQKDPLIEYKKEAYDLFNKMMHEIQSETIQYIFRAKFGIQVIGADEDENDTAFSDMDQEFNNPEEG